MLLLSSADIFKINILKIFSGIIYLTKCQMVWIQISTYIMLVLIWIQTVCRGYQADDKSCRHLQGESKEWYGEYYEILFVCQTDKASHYVLIILPAGTHIAMVFNMSSDGGNSSKLI